MENNDAPIYNLMQHLVSINYQNNIFVECQDEMKEIIESYYSISYLADGKSNLYLKLAAVQNN